MSWSEWTGSENLKAIFRHTLHCTVAILSFIWIAWLVRWGLGEGLLASFIEYVEKFILAVLFLVFLFNIGYDLWKEIQRNVKSSALVFS
jgi:hypothetical protein